MTSSCPGNSADVRIRALRGLVGRAGPAVLAACVTLGAAVSGAVGSEPLTELWKVDVDTIGFQGFEHLEDITVDAAGNAYVVGRLTRPIDPAAGDVNAGHYDGVLIKYDADGNRLWIRQFGTRRDERALSIASNSAGEVYITGMSWAGVISQSGCINTCDTDVFIAKYDPSGTQVWLKYYGTATFDNARDIAIDGLGNLYIAGDTRGDFGGQTNSNNDRNHAMVAKFDPSGELIWTNLFGSSEEDIARSVAVSDLGDVFVAGYTSGNIDGGLNFGNGSDGFIGKFDVVTGEEQWMKQRGSNDSQNEQSYGVAVDAAGNVYHTGQTATNLFGDRIGRRDTYVVKYDPAGTQLAAIQFGVADRFTIPYSIAATTSGEAYLSTHIGPGLLASDIGHVTKFSTGGSGCVADFNGDQMLDFFDMSAFLAAFNAQDPSADLNGDLAYDFFDVSAFLTAFNAGCP